MFHIKRWLILIISIVINLCIGFAYSWSVFQQPLMDYFGWTASQTSFAFTINLSVLPVAMIFSGRFVKKYGPKPIVVMGGIIFGLGLYLSGLVESIYTMYLTYGVMAGSGIGLIYSCTVANTVKWFPDKKGLAGGLTAGGFGAGSLIFAPVAAGFIRELGVLHAFQALSILFSVVIILLGFFIASPDQQVEGEALSYEIGNNEHNLDTKEMMKTVDFYLIWGLMIFGCISGLMIISQASPIGQQKVGLSPEDAAYAVGFIGFANAVGRIAWGMVSDKFGRYNTLICMFVFSGIGLVILYLTSMLSLFLMGICLIAASYGGVFGIFPSITADSFGIKNIGMNYGVIMTGLSIGAIIGPKIASFAVETSGGSYNLAFIMTLVINFLAVIMVLIVKRVHANKRSALVSE